MDRNNECLMTGNAGFRETTQRFVNSVGVATWEWRKEKKKKSGARASRGYPLDRRKAQETRAHGWKKNSLSCRFAFGDKAYLDQRDLNII